MIKKNKNQTILISNPKNIRHFTNLKCSFGFLLIKEEEEKILFVDSRYIEMAKKVFKEGKVILMKNILTIEKYIENIKTIFIESDFVTINQEKQFKKLNKEINYINGQKLRKIKTKENIRNLNKAIKITKKVMDWAFQNLYLGITEKEIANKIVYQLKKLGSEELDYPPIVSFGKNTSLPHAEPMKNKLKNNQNIMFDFGAVINGFTADITRNYFFGKVDKEIIKIEKIVKEAQIKTIQKIKPGIKCANLDKICRKYIKEKGYEKYFQHATGHGLGRDVHEFPIISSNSNETLEEGNVITIEPGIYIPNLGGIRIEDDILVTKDGFKILGK